MVNLHTSNGRFRYASQIVVGYATFQPSERLRSQRGDFVYLAWPNFRDASPELVDRRWHLVDDDLRWVATTSFHLPEFNGVDAHTRHVQNGDLMRGHGFEPTDGQPVAVSSMRPRAAVDFYQERVPANTGRFVFLPQNDSVPIPDGTLLHHAAAWPLSWDVVLLEPVPGVDVMHLPLRRRVLLGAFVDSDSDSDVDDDGGGCYFAPEPAFPVPWVPSPQHHLDPAFAKGPQFRSMHWSLTSRPFDHFGSCPVEELPVKGTRLDSGEEKFQRLETSEDATTPRQLGERVRSSAPLEERRSALFDRSVTSALMWEGAISATNVAAIRMMRSRPQISTPRASTDLPSAIQTAMASVERMQVQTQRLEQTFRETADATQRLERSFQESADAARRMADFSETLRDMVRNDPSRVEPGTGSMIMYDEIHPDPIHEEYRIGPRGRVRARAAAERAARTRDMEVAMFGAPQSRGRYERRRGRR